MKRFNYISVTIILAIVVLASCDGVRRNPGKIYMPDMAYSRALESYAQLDSTKFTGDMFNKGGGQIYFTGMPANGTIKRGELFPYTLPNDSNGYKMSATIKNPYDSITLTKAQMTEAGRLYNINCAICHGATGVANGPIAAAGHIGAVANLTADTYVKMADGTMFHSITYGKNQMGSYASQVTRAQRWMIIKYIRTLQPKPETAKAASDTSALKKG
jgi:mono/diheme cytochrome c family protein